METDVQIVQCPKCGIRNKIGMHSPQLRPICGHCGTILASSPSKQSHKTPPLKKATISFFSGLLFVAIASVGFGIAVTPSLLKKDYSELLSREQQKTKEIEKQYENHLSALKDTFQKELEKIDSETLRHNAALYYQSIIEARKSYDKRYALTPREKVQLRMRELASDSTKSYHQVIISVAREASPNGSDINVSESMQGVALHIDFDMSSMTSGEYGTRTKHHTKESLKKEVVSLISRVTNDIFQFCRGLDLETIYVGCRHHVRTRKPYEPVSDENTILYKVSIHKNRIPELTTNPFLDIYSTSQYLEVEEDNFEQIEIITTNL